MDGNGAMDDRALMQKLKAILLSEDREELQRLRAVLDDPEQLSGRVSPIIEEHLDYLKENFPIQYRIEIEKIVNRQLEASQEELIKIISPKLGTMVKEYIQLQFQLLKENLEEQLRNTFELGIIGRIRMILFGFKPKKMAETIISRMDGPVIEEMFVVEYHSGLLLGSASRDDSTIDLDMIAGMLTAIRAFGEDAFLRNEDLSAVQYQTYRILLRNFQTFYIATVLSGSISTAEQIELTDELTTFVEKYLKINLKKQDGSSNLEIKRRLKNYFFKPQQAILPSKTNKP